MADFQFFLNTQGLRGRTGAKGDDGFAPIISIGQNTLNTFTLMITTADGTFETPNLRGSIINNAGAGTYLRYDAETDSIYLSELQEATTDKIGGLVLATDEELAEGAGTGAITAGNLSDGIFGRLKAGDNIVLSRDEETDLITISSTASGGGGTSDYNELTNKPKLYGTEIVGDKKLSDFIELKAPLNESLGADYEKDVVIVNGNKTDDSLTLNTSWAPMFTDTSSASLPFNIDGDVTLNGNEFTPLSGVEMPYKVGDIIGVPGGTGADIALGNIREDGQFIFTHLLRVDGLGVSYINRAFMPVATKTNSSGTLKCTCDSTVTNELTTGQNFTDNCAYFQVRVEDGKMVAVFLKSVDGVFSNGVKVTSSNATTIANTEKLQRFSFGGVGSNVNLLSQFKLYRQPGLKLEECTDQSAFAGLTNMVNWKFPEDTTSISIKVDNDTVKIDGNGQLAVTDKVVKNNELNNYIKAGKDIEITKDELTNVLTIKNSAGAPFYKDLQGLPIFRNPLSKTFTVMAPLTGLSLSGDYVNVDTYTAWGQTLKGTSATSQYNFSIKKTYLSSYDTTKKTLKPKSYVAIPYSFGQIFTYDTGMGGAKALLANQQEDGTFEILGAICQSGDNLWYIGSNTDGAWGNDPIAFYGYRGSPVYQETPLPNDTVNMYQGFVQLIDNGDTVKAVMEYCYPYSVDGTKRSQCYVRTIDNATEVQKAQKVTHILISGFATNTNTWLKSSFGLYASDGKTLASDIPINSLSSYPNLFNIEESNETININCKVDGQTVVVDKNGNLSVGDDVMLKEQLYTQIVPGDNISITEDADTHKITISSTGGGGDTPIATTDVAGKVKPDGTTITVTEDGTITAVGGGGGTVDVYTKAETDNLLAAKQDTLVSGANIKTINGESVLGEGNLVVSGSSGVEYADSNTIVNSTVGSTTLGPYTATSGISVDTNTGIATMPTSGNPQVSLDFTPVEFAGHTFDIQVAFKVRGNAPLSGLAVVWQEEASYSNRTAPQLFIQTNGNLTFDIPNANGTGWLVGDAPTGVTVSGSDTVVARLICDGSKITSSVSKNGGDPVEATIYNGAYVRTGTVQFMYGETSTASSAFKETIEYVDLMNTYVKYDGEYIWQSTSSIKNALAVKISSETNNALIAKTTGLFVEKVNVSEIQSELVTTQGDVAALDADVSTLKTTTEEHTTSISSINTLITQLTDRIAALEAEINGGNA